MTPRVNYELINLESWLDDNIFHFKQKGVNVTKVIFQKIKGLLCGKIYASKGDPLIYSYQEIKVLFERNQEYINSIICKTKFKDEQHLINYVFKIMHSKLVDVPRPKAPTLPLTKDEYIKVKNENKGYIKRSAELKFIDGDHWYD